MMGMAGEGEVKGNETNMDRETFTSEGQYFTFQEMSKYLDVLNVPIWVSDYERSKRGHMWANKVGTPNCSTGGSPGRLTVEAANQML